MVDTWTPAEVERQRLVRYQDLVPCTAAFIDAKTPGSHLKENFTIIGPGVAENPRQHVHIREKHGFNIGGARQQAHILNSQHSHETAEVFVVISGQWAMRAGVTADDAEVVLGPGDLISLPTRLFRGFENVSPDGDTGFLFSILGGDDPGRVTWAPDVLRQAESHGLVLLDDGRLIDTTTGEQVPDDARVVRPLTSEQVDLFDRVTSAELEHYVVRATAMTHQQPLIAPDAAPIASLRWPNGFSVEAVRGFLPAAADHRARVLLTIAGSVELSWEDGSVRLSTGDTLTIPRNLECGLETLGEHGLALLVTGDEEHPVPFPLPTSMYLVPAAAADE